MRTNTPPSFRMSFAGPEGAYTLEFCPLDDWDGLINVTIGGVSMKWDVQRVDLEPDGALVLSGMTAGSEKRWQDQWWFELRRDDQPAVVRYWGDQVLWREDVAVN